MKYRLGLDLGTNSIGWCALELDNQGSPSRIVDTGVRLLTPNQEAGRDPQSKQSLAADRRAARQARRQRDRFVRRQRALMRALVAYGLMPDHQDARKALERLDPYQLRAAGLDEPLELHELGRALFHINQRRGFKSNRLAQREDEEDSVTRAAAKALREALQREGARTVGEFLWRRHKRREAVRFRPTPAKGNKVSYDFYPNRDLVEDELDRLWAAQKPHHPEVLTVQALEAIKHIILHQRPLAKPLVGPCTFRPEEERAPKALPDFQRFRILQDLASLEVEQPGIGSRKLSLNERDTLLALLLNRKTRVAFDKMAAALGLPANARFNYAASGRDGFDPDLTAAKLGAKKVFGNAWGKLKLDQQNTIVERLLGEEDENALLDYLEEQCRLPREPAERASRTRLPQGHGSLGRSMLNDLVAVMQREASEAVDPETGEIYEAPVTYDEALARLGFHHSDLRPGELYARLPYYGDVLKRHVVENPAAPEGSQERRGRVTNPTVHIALNQTRRLINALIAEYGAPEQVVVELARELKWGRKRKDDYNRRLRENRAANERRDEKLAQLGLEANRDNRLRLRLFEELPPSERVCVYTGSPLSVSSLFSSEVEVDHVLPFSLTLDDSIGNKVLCTREANRDKQRRPPAQAFDSETLAEIAKRANRLFPRKAWRFDPDAMERFQENGGWQARQLTDTQYMARLAKTYLECICPSGNVWAIPGRMTGMLRGVWGLNSILAGAGGSKNRNDHRHHAIDAFVVACSDRGLLQRISRAATASERLDLDRLFGADGVPEPWRGVRHELSAALEKVVVSHKTDHGQQGQLHEETAYGLVEDDIDGKPYNLVFRKPVADLTPNEAARVRDPQLRGELTGVIQGAQAEGEKLNIALARFGDQHGVRRVRVLKTERETRVVRHGEGYYKAYVPGDNYCVDIYELPDGEWRGEGITLFDVNQPDYAPSWRADHPCAKLIMRVHKGDLLEATINGARNIYRIYRLNPRANRLWLAVHNQGGVEESDFVRPSYRTLQEGQARLLHVDVLGRTRPIEPAA